jgi:hypothetical protein
MIGTTMPIDAESNARKLAKAVQTTQATGDTGGLEGMEVDSYRLSTPEEVIASVAPTLATQEFEMIAFALEKVADSLESLAPKSAPWSWSKFSKGHEAGVRYSAEFVRNVCKEFKEKSS